jgi:hypothetical protein
MGVVLEEVFEGVPTAVTMRTESNVAIKCTQSAKKGNATLDGLRGVARDALLQLSARRSACEVQSRIVANRRTNE